MLTCKLCGKELKNKRAVHAHLMTVHAEQYRAAGMKQDKFLAGSSDTSGTDPRQEAKEKKSRPDGFRHLNAKNQAERAALEFYDYIDAEENLYTTEEAKQKGYI